MKLTLGWLATFGFYFIGSDANVLVWGAEPAMRPWTPAEKTLGSLFIMDGMSPKPTVAPRAPNAAQLVKRDTSICGYVSGKLTLDFDCGRDVCGYNSVSSYIGCCSATGTCHVPTVCYESTQSSLYSTDNGYTIWCGSSKYPNCATYTYEDVKGYSLLWCNVAKGTHPVYLTALTSTTISTSSTRSTTTTDSTTISDPTSTSTGGTSPTTSPADSGSSVPAGAIAGGVVGGVAVLGLIAFGIWFIIYRSRKKDQPPVSPATAATGYDGSSPAGGPGGYPTGAAVPQMANAWSPPQQQYGFPPGQQMQPGFSPPQSSPASFQKGYDQSYHSAVTGTSPAGSPPPPHSPVNGFPAYNTVSTPSSQDASYHKMSSALTATELSTDRPDGALRELAG